MRRAVESKRVRDFRDPRAASLSKVIALATALNATPDDPRLASETFGSYISDGDDPVDLLTGAMNLCTLLLVRLEKLAGRDPADELQYLATRYGEQ